MAYQIQENKKGNTDFLIFSLFTLFAVATWTGFEIYKSLTSATAPQVTAEQLQSLDPKLPVEVLSVLEGRRLYADQEIANLVVTPAPTGTPTVSPSPTEALTPTETP